MSIVTLQLAKAHLNLAGNDDDELISLYLDAAEAWLDNYIGEPIADMNPIPADLKLAVLKLASFYYEQREAITFGAAMQIVPYGVTSIANSYYKRWFGNVE